MDAALWIRPAVGLALAATLAYMTTPLAIRAARRLAFYDVPFGYKGHRTPTPYLGGAAVMAAFTVVLLGVSISFRTVSLVGGVGVMFVLGTIDDRRTVSPLLRVAVEFALGALLSTLGHGWHLGAGGGLDAVLTGVWVVGIVNAFNLFDNMDGAASTMAIAATAGTSILALVTHNTWAAAGSAALCGACLGFLPYNLAKPARIFLGDGGSMPLGFAVAILTASAARTAEPSGLALLTGLLLVGVPALDTCLVIISRRRRGISILTGGQDHLTHRTRRRMRTARRVALVLGSAQVLVSALVIVATRSGSSAVVYVLLGFLICAATAIVGLEGSMEFAPIVAPVSAGATAVAMTGTTALPAAGPERSLAAPAFAPPSSRPQSPTWATRGATLGLAVLGLGAGLSPLFSAYFDTSVWVPIGLMVILAGGVSAIVRPPGASLPVVLSLTALAGLGLWSLLSMSWAQAAEQATVDGNRWLAYAALLMLLIGLVRRRVHASVLLAAVGAGIVVVGVTVLVRMLGSDPISLFIGGRLNSPLGYINGEGCVFAMGCWLSLALAERREPVLAGLGAAATVVLASLTLLTQSRGAAIATFVALIVALVVVPGVRRRVMALATIGAGVAAAAGPTVRVYTAGQSGAGFGSAAHSAVIAILVFSALAGVVWAAITAIALAGERRGERSAVLIGRVATVLTALVLLAPVVAAVVRAPTLERTARNQWHAFVHLSVSATSGSSAVQTRLFSGAGNRYDYWRVAWHVFTRHPLIGVGAGNFTASYYAQRHTQEAIQNPHSIELQMLSELGIVGAGLLVLLICGGVIGARRLRLAARRSRAQRTTMVAATGVAVVWMVDTSGDWMHLLPGVTAIALTALAVLCRSPRAGGSAERDPSETSSRAPDPGPNRSAGLPVRTLGLAACAAFALVVGGASLLRSGLSQHYLNSAQSELSATPALAIADASSSLRLDGANLDAYYVKAAGQARFNRAAAAQATLLAAARADSRDYVTWTLLGDLEVRRGNFGAARVYYSRAHTLDPSDPGLASLAADPAGAQTAAPGG